MTEQVAKTYFSKELLSWYRLQKRDLPWRKNRDPYRIWVSEIMLQQTRVDTVIPYYHTFMSKFPTVRSLAEAPEEEVLKCWEGLGYYSRARNLQAGARMVVEKYDGIIPDDKMAVSGLKGVGPYTSGAIMSIAFNRPEPAVDGNVMRVLSRYFCLEEDIAKPATRVGIEKLAVTLIPEGAAGDFNQALMELGALVCTPKSPSCLPCPVMEHCEARHTGRELELPIKTKAKAPRKEFRSAVIVLGKGENEGKILVRQRPATGLLAQMWELPHLQVPDDKSQWFSDSALKEQGELAEMLSHMVEGDTGLLIRPRNWLMDADHIFSHIVWKMRVYVTDLGEESVEDIRKLAAVSSEDLPMLAAESNEEYEVREVANTNSDVLTYRWISKEDMEQLPFPNLFLKILQYYWN
ncbi:A/G-specific adenine glycosylase [Paenibacillus sp. GSMTC-2017]|uniref:A/G-specific adenine glycosylase n=1 Tax=Paenibacillus sp. GSMTC-2017 TaxID=2794350 RepID=UPI0018D93CD0|nr:A/G-specific adenine glycosylase [Paenibacillus sp. GSMTC-2017]MBH5319105.1 A/G-specific adenine glycosylase [Paenibacillus sp. GSMTC-2017]